MKEKINTQQLNRLYDVVSSLKSREDCGSFFSDLCTVAELQAMGQRLHVAELLCEGRVYTDIARETGASTATISRVNRSLNYGMNGYKSALGDIKKV